MRTENSLFEIAVAAMCEAGGMRRGELLGRRRPYHLACARWIVWALLKSKGYRHAEIGRLFGRDHGTVQWGLNHLEGTLASDLRAREWQANFLAVLAGNHEKQERHENEQVH